MPAPSFAASWQTMYRFIIQDLIWRLAAENALWGAPRSQGELLKLGIATSKRTISRYLRGRPPTRSQTWRTFFANHLDERTFLSPLMVWDARSDDVIVDNYDVSSRPASLSIDGSGTSIRWAGVDQRGSLQQPVSCRASRPGSP
jgi:hypothetical protein